MTMPSVAGAAPSAEPYPPESPDISALSGDWLNTDGGAVSKGPVRLTVAPRGTGLAVRAFGSTAGGQPYDWGEVPAVLYTAPGTPSLAWAFSSVYELGGFRTVLCAYYKTGILVATASRVPVDGGGRPGEWSRSFFHRLEEGA
ncbi:hypothetical protein JIX56_08660 [Streptomyces sp. CA-210063]|uniref:hypothetical protein n=1 Tax=Streptomyces sp. CA-210063 TaxID=2801029 RepID=UPI00214ACB84|nr:hypothetical protein [Streptomyces sp. CA-210063]UUU29950.1 hypothetical protein JIX56_08660 [Streptomyces sp. CA-210063]